MWKLYLVRCETAFVFCFLREKWIIVYRLLHRHRCRRGKRSGRLHCARMELLSLLRFSLCDVFMTGGIYIVFSQIVYRKPRFFCFWTVYRGLCWISPWTCAHRQLPCKSFSERFWCCMLFFFGFLMCNEGWFLCFAIIMTSDFLLDLMFYRSFDGIVFLQKFSLKFLRCGELSF